MGIAALAAEIERLRSVADEVEQALAAERAARLEEKRLFDLQAMQLHEANQKVQALAEANEVLARKLGMLELKRERKNERFVEDPAQIALLPASDIEPPPRLPTAEPESAEDPIFARSGRTKKKERGKPKRRDLSTMDHLPLREVHCPMDPSAVCNGCDGPLVVIGTSKSWRLHFVPGHFERLHVLKDKCACPKCPQQGVLTVPDPFILSRALCSNDLLAAVLVDKFADHIPLNRQATRMERQGVSMSTAVLSAWVFAVAHPSQGLLSRVAAAILAELLQADALRGDDTGHPVQDGVDGKLRKGRLWAVTDGQQSYVHFTDDKAGHRICSLLEHYTGKLILVDGGSEFNRLVRTLELERAGCWSHLRRYFFDARHHHPNEAALALRTIRDLFALERSLEGASPERVREVRRQDARPLVEGLFTWIDQLSTTVRPSSLLGEAVGYARNQRDTFFVFLDHPELPMHNNLSELLLRGPVVGRKVWLFSGSEGGAEAAAVMFTLIGSCMLQAVDPLVYLTDVLNRLPFHPANRVHELTPLQWRLGRERAATGASPAAP